MKVILQQDIKKLGKKGEIVEVSEGYGRNFLLPRKAAVLANAENMNVAKAQAGSKARKEAMATDEAKLMAAQLEKVSVTIPVKIGENGKLFGSVTGKDVADALKKEKIDIDRRKISIKGEVTGAGEYEAVIKVHPAITSTIKVNVVAG
ncbi:putative 50S ribosomal protein L9 [Selenomonas ruminantium subsp. lactilytica TAM6421]|uniref:Large ribosomal subunit protein bL9 n=1 Tax=Selenomonas ruminantium subsp. lactilytica (strain NBRC 103574 / TAM6421) TaxID=927704 RepID=I0GLT1_SELRL|nr:50S ribosomal protein L9 [Selenomonas ruminantium]BAL81718.1 putative 50S ribosomal protein L9 [Selenomonas ruminantium subsp. lactilytica TAM6421]